MNKLTIIDIGPVKNITIELNKLNVFIGPQSSGKSTIAKIISYCQWVEKRYLLDGEYNYEFSEQFMEFHRIDKNYFNENSYFKYESNFVSISFNGSKFKQTIKKKRENLNYKKSKNIYIPAERNFVSVIPNLGKFKESNDNIMSFLYDWFDAKKNYIEDNKFPILNLGVKYHYVNDEDLDILTLTDNNKISLKNASSGLQSIIPLLMLVNYLTIDFYKGKKSRSVYENEKIKILIQKTIDDFSKKEFKKNDVDYLLNIIGFRSNYHFSNFIIEEPEQNLFPETQRDLIYFLINRINYTKKDHILTITTHSPYILYALNNCILGHQVKDVLPSDVKDTLLSKNSWIDPKLVSIWEIKNGKIKSIKNDTTGTLSKHYFNKNMNEIMDEYYEMLNFLEI